MWVAASAVPVVVWAVALSVVVEVVAGSEDGTVWEASVELSVVDAYGEVVFGGS